MPYLFLSEVRRKSGNNRHQKRKERSTRKEVGESEWNIFGVSAEKQIGASTRPSEVWNTKVKSKEKTAKGGGGPVDWGKKKKKMVPLEFN